MQRSTINQYGFSILEVLVVLTISSILLSTLMTSMVASSRVTTALSSQNHESSKHFFFDLQFSALVSEIYEWNHPDLSKQVSFHGDRTEFSGVFANVFSEAKQVTAFSVTVKRSDNNLTRLHLSHVGEEQIWLETDSTISFQYIDERGTKTNSWPVEKETSNFLAAPIHNVVLPVAIVMNIEDDGSLIEKVFILND